MEQLSNQKKLRPWMGFVVQAGFLGLFVTAGAWMQRNYGIPGLIGSELMFLIVAVLYCLIRRVKLTEMFPVKKITGREFWGVLILAVAGFLLSMVGVGISLAVLPKSFRSEITGLTDFLYGKMNYLEMVLVVALLPALCEEAMERGCVLSHFRSIKRDWVIVLIMGVFFGIMHMSPLRFLSTATAGALMSYLLVKKNNILLPMLMHFMNNFASVTLSYLGNQFLNTEGASEQVMELNGLTTLGAYMFFAFAAPVLLVVGMMLIDPEHHKAIRFAIAGGISAVMLFGGFGITAATVLQDSLSSGKALSSGESSKSEYIVGADVTREEMTEFWFTRSGSTNPPTFQRYEILCEGGKWFLYHETREGDHWPLEESDVTVSGKIELTETECDELWTLLSGGKVTRRQEDTSAGGDGPWLYLYWKEGSGEDDASGVEPGEGDASGDGGKATVVDGGDVSEFQEYTFASFEKQKEFEDWCAARVEKETQS